MNFRKKSFFLALFTFFFSLGLFCQAKSAMTFFNDGYDCQCQGNYFKAVENYQEALALNPKYADAWYNLSLSTFYLGEYDLALEYAETAEKYSRNYCDIKNLKGMCCLAQGKIDEAEKYFKDVLSKEPNNIEARFGQAEIAIYRGSLISAKNYYQDALKRDQKSRKALLSLALVCAEQGLNDQAESFIKQALTYHSGEAEVHYLASYLAAKRGDTKEAERQARSAVQISPDYDKAYELLGQILFSQKRYSEVIDICDYRIGRNRELSDAWYLKGISEVKLNLQDRAISTFSTGLSINPQDEVMRLAFEQVVADTVKIEDSRRSDWAKFHIEKANEYKRNYNGPAERFEWQKALVLDPLNIPARQSYASMLERDKLYELYLYQLNFIKKNESVSTGTQTDEDSPSSKKTDRQIKNDYKIEALENMMQNNLAHRWNVDPFYLDKCRWNMGLYYVENPANLKHANLESIMVRAISDVFSGVAQASLHFQSQAVTGYAQAYSLARAASYDYFFIVSVDESDRTFRLDLQMYSARSGTKTKDFHIYRTGNDKVANTLIRFRSSLLDILPIRGKILKSSAGQILVDLGKSDGIVKGAKFDVVKKGKIKTKDTGPGVTYSSEDLLGTYTVELLGEEISSGTFEKKGFYNMMNVGDEVVLVELPSEGQSQSGNIAQDNRPQSDADGSAITAAAEKNEKDVLKENMKNQVNDSSLLEMLRQII